MRQIVRLDLGPEGRAYLRTCLCDGYDLAQRLLQEVSLEVGHAWTLVPASAAPEHLQAFEEGNAFWPMKPHDWAWLESGVTVPISDALAVMAWFLHAWLTAAPRRLCVLEDPIRSPRDAGLEKFGTRNAAFGSEQLLHVIQPGQSVEEVDETLRRTVVLPSYVGCLTVHERLTTKWPIESFTDEDLCDFARRAEAVFVGAYDGDSYVVWTKEPPIIHPPR